MAAKYVEMMQNPRKFDYLLRYSKKDEIELTQEIGGKVERQIREKELLTEMKQNAEK